MAAERMTGTCTPIPKTSSRRIGASKAAARANPAHLAWVRLQPCCAGRCQGRGEAHHVRTAANSGTGIKPPDTDSVPLCRKHHAELHKGGAWTFQTTHEIDLEAVAARMRLASPHA